MQTKIVKDRVPAGLLTPCPPRWRKAGGPATVGDFVDRGDQNEAALGICAARLRKVAEWDAKR